MRPISSFFYDVLCSSVPGLVALNSLFLFFITPSLSGSVLGMKIMINPHPMFHFEFKIQQSQTGS